MKYDAICAGEALVDLLSGDYADSLAEVKSFAPHAGGSPANLASNLHYLDKKVALVACVGPDSFGRLLLQDLEEKGLSSAHIRIDPWLPSSLALVARTRQTPDFEIYRAADKELEPSQFANLLGEGARIFHTTCFALSVEPSRSVLLEAAEAFAKTGTQLSIDANYAAKVWPNQAEAREVVAQYCKLGAFIKMSEDDYERLYGKSIRFDAFDAEAKALLNAGAKLVCFTFGAQGAACIMDDHSLAVPAPKMEIVDATGAGDSFWAGFLSAWLDGLGPSACLAEAARVAALKLSRIGPLRKGI